ncbi:hypothetical protein SCHPADRAFT_897116, partial [Schizopora paradoxa]
MDANNTQGSGSGHVAPGEHGLDAGNGPGPSSEAVPSLEQPVKFVASATQTASKKAPNGEAPELVLDPILPQGPTAGGDLMPIQSHEFHGPLATIDEGTEAELDAPPGGLSADGNPSNNPPFPGTPPIAPPSGAPVFIDPAPDTSILTRNYFFGQPNIHAPATAGHDLLYRISPQLSNAAQAVIQ